jgi:hypothetical protein
MHVCTWGKYDPATGVDLSLGLPAPTLGKILHDKGLKLKKLNPDYVFQVDVTGALEGGCLRCPAPTPIMVSLPHVHRPCGATLFGPM